MKTLIVILVLFSSSLFAKDWDILPGATIRDILDKGYELKEVTVDPSSRDGFYRIFYHFISYEYKVIAMCSVDIEYGTPKDTFCYANPQ